MTKTILFSSLIKDNKFYKTMLQSLIAAWFKSFLDEYNRKTSN